MLGDGKSGAAAAGMLRQFVFARIGRDSELHGLPNFAHLFALLTVSHEK